MAKVHFIGAGQMTEAIIRASLSNGTLRADAISLEDIDSWMRNFSGDFDVNMMAIQDEKTDRYTLTKYRSGGGGEPRARPAKRLDDGGFSDRGSDPGKAGLPVW